MTHCLSNHTQIFCDRGEPLHHMSVWCTSVTANRQRILNALFNQTGYQISMCRLTYVQALDENIWKYLIVRQPMVIWLHRENLLRQAISVHFNRMDRRAGSISRPAHTFRYVPPARITIDPELFIKYACGLQEQNERMKAALSKFKQVYRLTYADVVGGEGQKGFMLPYATSQPLCKWLGVREESLACDLRPVNPYPLPDLISNWKAVVKAIQASSFAPMLEELQ